MHEDPSKELRSSSAEVLPNFAVAATPLRQKGPCNQANIEVISNDSDGSQDAELNYKGLSVLSGHK